ncbi:MAG TPA: RnfABCDGE type electron transport complex subunit D [Pseudomonas sp.]|nr:RnfABCDGE type electron transport complex subunit D [Pseudomonas sp.]
MARAESGLDAEALRRTQRAMGLVLLATLPGVLALLWLHGWGTLFTLLLANTSALGCEALLLRLRQRPSAAALDGSALVSATLLALALPPYSPWWLTLTAIGFAIAFGKQLFGGLGKNPFNPAMLGYALALLAFPQQMTQWPASPGPGFLDGLQQILGMSSALPDAWTQATALDVLRVDKSLTMDELFAGHPSFGQVAGRGAELVNLAFLAGGLFLLQRRLYGWHAPLGMLAGLFVMSLLFWNGSGSDSHGSPLFQLLSGATMLGAFFIVTEPVSGADSPRARLLFGLGVGVLTYVIRAWGGYPDGLAFAVLLMNLLVPTLERIAVRRAGETP